MEFKRKKVKEGSYFVVLCSKCHKKAAEIKIRRKDGAILICRGCLEKYKADKKRHEDMVERYVAILKEQLPVSDDLLHDAIVFIYDTRQTPFEQAVDDACQRNHVGFTKFDAGPLSYFARWIKSGKRLTGKHLEMARRRMPKYARQLAKATKPENIHTVVMKYANKEVKPRCSD